MIITDRIRARQHARKNNLMNSAFDLFLSQGLEHTSIDDIVRSAKMAKGTFYLYFKDKYDLRNQLIVRESKRIFDSALSVVKQHPSKTFVDDLINVIDAIIDELEHNQILLRFLSKDLSIGVLSAKFPEFVENDELDFKGFFYAGVKRDRLTLKNSRVALFMIVELVSSTIFTSITRSVPLPLVEYKPYLYAEIRKMLA